LAERDGDSITHLGLTMTALSLIAEIQQPATTVIEDDFNLVERAKRDPKALGLLYDMHYEAIARYIARRVGASDAEDLTAEVFLAMVRYLPRFRSRGVPFRAWLYRLATNQVNRWARRRRPDARHRLAEIADRRGETCTAEQADVVRMALLTLPPRFQSALTLHYLEGLSVAEVAGVLNCAEGTVKSRLARGRDMMRAALQRPELRWTNQ
jgi:RNA polymerase sigma-70 factor (ECF subfamily)